jgi:uncharacterized protein (TIGR02646 family)
MEFIAKQPFQPQNWDLWFTDFNRIRITDYGEQSRNCPNLHIARSFLLQEQNYLCAYCQKTLTPENTSIEHVIPKSQNQEQSTQYHNLVAVCKTPQSDPADPHRYHCDKERGNKLLPPIIFYSDATCNYLRNNSYFVSRSDGTILPKETLPPPIYEQVKAFISILNLNHTLLKNSRNSILQPILMGAAKAGNNRQNYFLVQFDRINNNPSHPFRLFILSYLLNKLGYN